MKTNVPQNVATCLWYYENKGSIDVVVNAGEMEKAMRSGRARGAKKGCVSGDLQGVIVRIPSSMLMNTLRRQGKIN